MHGTRPTAGSSLPIQRRSARALWLCAALWAVGCGEPDAPERATRVVPVPASPGTPGPTPSASAALPSAPGVWVDRPASACTEERVQRWEGAHRFGVHAGHVFTAGPAGVREWDLRGGRERALSAAPLNVNGVAADATHVYAWTANPIVRGRDSVQRLDLRTLALTPVAEGLSGMAVNPVFVVAGQLYWMDMDTVGEARLMRLAGAGGAPEVLRSLPRSQFKLGLSQAGRLVVRSAFEAEYVVGPEPERAPPGAEEPSTDGFYELSRDGFPRVITWRPMRGPEREVGSVSLSGSVSFAGDSEAVVVAYQDAFLGELHLLPISPTTGAASGPARRIAHRLVLPQQPALVDGCLFFLQGEYAASETVFYTRVHPSRAATAPPVATPQPGR